MNTNYRGGYDNRFQTQHEHDITQSLNSSVLPCLDAAPGSTSFGWQTPESAAGAVGLGESQAQVADVGVTTVLSHMGLNVS